MKKSEIEKLKPVIHPVGNGKTVTVFEDAAGHRYEYDAPGKRYRLLVHSDTGVNEDTWRSLEAEGAPVNADFTQVGANDIQGKSQEGVVGASDVGNGGDDATRGPIQPGTQAYADAMASTTAPKSGQTVTDVHPDTGLTDEEEEAATHP